MAMAAEQPKTPPVIRDRSRSKTFKSSASLVAGATRLMSKSGSSLGRSPDPSIDQVEPVGTPKLRIEEEDLSKLRKPILKPLKPTKHVAVSRPKPMGKPKKAITVAMVAPENYEPRDPTPCAITGPQYDLMGNILPFSILGSVDDFFSEAQTRGEYQSIVPADTGFIRATTPSVRAESVHPMPPHRTLKDEEKALSNWMVHMKDRKKQQERLAKMLECPTEHLAMNSGIDYRQKQEERYLIDRTLAGIDYGKGYRIGSEFWALPERLGGEDGIDFCLTETEKGFPPPIEHVSFPQTIKEEMGEAFSPGRIPTAQKHFHDSEFRSERLESLAPHIKEIYPHQPDVNGLIVIGNESFKQSSINLSKSKSSHSKRDGAFISEHSVAFDDVIEADEGAISESPTNLKGPHLLLGETQTSWGGNSNSRKGSFGPEIRVNFKCFSGSSVVEDLKIINNGSTVIKVDWKRQESGNLYKNPFYNVQRFYYNTDTSILVPNQSIEFPFVFKSPNSGIFTESWTLETTPVLECGSTITVTLRGIALEEDILEPDRDEIEKILESQRKLQVVRRILDDVINGVQERDRPRSPVDAYITTAERFERFNPGTVYMNETVNELSNIYNELLPKEDEVQDECSMKETTVKDSQWSLSLDDLFEVVDKVVDDKEREKVFKKVHSLCYTLMHKPVVVTSDQTRYNVCYGLLVKAIDDMVNYSHDIKYTNKIPAVDLNLPADVPNKPLGTLQKLREREDAKRKAKGDPVGVGKKDKGKDKGKARPTSKSGKAATPARETPSKSPVKKGTPVGELDGANGTAEASIELIDEQPIEFKTPEKEVVSHYYETIYLYMYERMRRFGDRLGPSLEDVCCSSDSKYLL